MAHDGQYPKGWFFQRTLVRLVGSDEPEIGVVTLAEAIRRAKDGGFKLAEIDTSTKLTVVKLMNAEQFEQHLRDTQHLAN